MKGIAVSRSISILLASLVASSCTPTLPAPNTTIIEAPPALSYESFCQVTHGLRQFTVQSRQLLTGAIECQPGEATIVIFNSNAVRVRTIRLAKGGVIVDELSFLSGDNTPTLELLQELSHSLQASELTGTRKRVQLISSTP